MVDLKVPGAASHGQQITELAYDGVIKLPIPSLFLVEEQGVPIIQFFQGGHL